MPTRRALAGLLGAWAPALLLAACSGDNAYVAPPPPKVTVAPPLKQPFTRYLEATGTTAAVNTADLVARVQGFIQQISYKDGDQVKEGTLLFTIEPEPYQLKLDQAKAAQAGAEASLKQLQAEFDRQSELVSRQAASKAALDNATGNRDGAKAKLLQAQADTKQAEINLGYTAVKAPFDGIVTARQVSVGQYVGSTTQPTVLATIIQIQPIYVNFSISEQDVLRIRERMGQRPATPEYLKTIPFEVGLQTETGYPHKGHLDYAAPNVDQSTGTLMVRGIIENTDRALLPGLFTRVRVPSPRTETALFVPEASLGADQTGRYVLVVNKDNVVEQRKVETGPLVDTLRVIEKGLADDDRVVVAGVQRAVPGQKVDPQPEPTKAAAR
jgi:RND family efflux transporter MFP subunit